MISWNHFVPSYVRNELKKKTGIVIDENGNRVNIPDEPRADDLFKKKDPVKQIKQQQNNFTPIKSYRPNGNLIYGDAFDKLEKKFS
jgi:hypothetical protein